MGKSSDKVELQNVSGGSLVVGCDRYSHVGNGPGSLPGDLVPNRQTLNRISKSHKLNQISNRSDENRIINGQIESREAIQSQFKLNRDWDLPITGRSLQHTGYV